MEATHFIEVWKSKYSGQLLMANCNPIDWLNICLGVTVRDGLGETIAVWRIKPTDVPLQERLLRRVLRETELLQKRNHAF